MAATTDAFDARLARLGDIPPERVRLTPTPGTATERDAIEAWERDRRLCELVDGDVLPGFVLPVARIFERLA